MASLPPLQQNLTLLASIFTKANKTTCLCQYPSIILHINYEFVNTRHCANYFRNVSNKKAEEKKE